MIRSLTWVLGLCTLVLAAGDVFGDPGRSKTVYLTDMGRCSPESALSTATSNTQWQVASYDAGQIKGKMIVAQAFATPPEVRLPVNETGWHAISIGFWPGIYDDCSIRYKLSNEDVFTLVHHKHKFQWTRTDLIETFPRYADLTDVQSIVFGTCEGNKACIAYVKLEPLGREKVRAIRQDRARSDTRRLIQLFDGDGVFHSLPWNLRTRDSLRELVAGYRHSDFRMIMWGANAGDLTFYPTTEVGRFHVSKEGPATRINDKKLRENHSALAKAGVPNPFEVVLQQTHDMGMEFHLYYRMALADHRHPVTFSSAESFWLAEHPECRMLAKDGTPLDLASYAFPQVRQFMLSLIAEGMQYDIDGVNLCLIRGPEYFGYEKPVVDDFKKLYGQDPRELPDHEQRLQKLRAGYMTEFIRAVRKAADKHGARRGRKIQVSTYVQSTDERMRYVGYDCYGWIEEKLVDFVLAGATTPRLVALAKKTGCKVYIQGDRTGKSAVGKMKRGYAGGYEGMWFWDGDMMPFLPETWRVVSRLGHRDEVTARRARSKGLPQMRRIKLRSIAGHNLSDTVSKNVPGGWPPPMLTLYTGG